MLSDASAGRFSHLGLYRANRFGRNTVEGLKATTQLMSLGFKIRIANMPGLQPENPDGYFLSLLQMGLAQREKPEVGHIQIENSKNRKTASNVLHKLFHNVCKLLNIPLSSELNSKEYRLI